MLAFVTTSLPVVPTDSGSFELYKNPRRSVPDELRPAIRRSEDGPLPEAQPWEDLSYLDAVGIMTGMEIIPRGDGSVDPDDVSGEAPASHSDESGGSDSE